MAFKSRGVRALVVLQMREMGQLFSAAYLNVLA